MDSSNSTSYSSEPENKRTLSTNQQIAPEMSHNDAAAQDFSASGFQLVGRCRSRRRRTHMKKISKDACCGGGEELSDENDEVEKKIEALQKIVPGGERLPVEKLFEETADYILTLECQVKALRLLAALVQGSEKKRRMLGG